MLSNTSLGHLMKNRGTTTTMQLNVTQNTTSLWNTERSPKKGGREEEWHEHVTHFTQCRVWCYAKGHGLTTRFMICLVLPRGVKKMMEETRKPRMRPATITQAITEPNRHQVITRTTPPTTPIRTVRANRTARTDRGNKMTSRTCATVYKHFSEMLYEILNKFPWKDSAHHISLLFI